MAGLVRLHWQDSRDPAGSGHAILPRARAERLVHWILGEYGPRYELAIEPLRPMAGASPPTKENPVTWALFLGFLQASLSFLKTHRALLFALVAVVLLGASALLAVYLPTAKQRAFPVAALGFGTFGFGVLAAKELESL